MAATVAGNKNWQQQQPMQLYAILNFNTSSMVISIIYIITVWFFQCAQKTKTTEINMKP